ncbi:glycosyltransferase, partial [Paenibacillus forsythiae]|uniref:glycosyltransferase n=1 Tax=Paenibacillus forsythiae TaxID=365616 RepID=UPI00046F83DA
KAVEATGSADIAFVSLVNEDVFDTVLPGKIIDYMCMGKPIVGAISGYAAEVIERANCGYVSRARRSEEIQRYIMELMESEALRKQLGDNGSEYAYRNFRWEENIRVLTKVLEREYEEKSVHVCVESFHQ